MEKQYFKYHGKISSIELSQAFASTLAPGAFAGFNSYKCTRQSGTGDWVLEVYPYGSTTDNPFTYYQNKDNSLRRYISQAYNEGSINSYYNINFGCITKDGSIYTSDQEKISGIPIKGDMSDTTATKELILFAVHEHNEVEIDNPVTLIAYWNTSDISLYDLYKKSINITYNSTSITDPLLDGDLTFANLDEKVKAACEAYYTNYSRYTIVGIYGTYSDKPQMVLVPYMSQFPAPLSYNTALHSYVTQVQSALDKSLEIINELETELYKDIGTIRIWASDNTPPDNYLICDGQYVDQSVYADLYNVIGNTYNTSYNYRGERYTTPPTGTFRLPDLRARFIVGKGVYDKVGDVGGEAEVTLLEKNLPAHSHVVHNTFFSESHDTLTSGNADGKYGYRDGKLQLNVDGNVTPKSSEGLPGTNYTVDYDNDTMPYMDTPSESTGDGVGHNNLPPYYTLVYIIKAKI